jgi:hypothetical protein
MEAMEPKDKMEALKIELKFDELAQEHAACIRTNPPTLDQIRRQVDPALWRIYGQLGGPKEDRP